MSRFVYGLDTPGEIKKEAAYIVETEVPLVFSRYTPDKVTAEKNVYLITKLEKSGTRIFLVPGVIAVILFFRSEGDEETAKAVQAALQDYFTSRIKGASADGNDLLINKKKIMGITVIQRIDSEMMMVRYMLTVKAEHIAAITTATDFEDRKYKNITGICDETDLSTDEVREIVEESIKIVTAWRTKDDPE
jgi:lipoate-protein ligase A